jgi:GT2 family glycosyltransferase
MPEIIVVIVNYNAGHWLRDCLAALAAQTCRDFRVVVVDNGSSDGSLTPDLAPDLAHLCPGLQLERLGRNSGFAAANNIGVARAPASRWIACLNPDALPAPDWLEQLLAFAAAHPEYAFFGSRMELAEDPERLDGTGDIYHSSGLVWRRDHLAPAARVRPPGEIFAPCAAAALYRRDVFLEAGGFDEDFFCYLEDVDLAFRLRLLGYRCAYVADARVRHAGSATTGYRSDFSVYHGHRNLVWTFVQNMPGWLFWYYLPLHLLMNLVSLAVFARRGQGRLLLRAKWDALRGLGAALAKRRRRQAGRRVPPGAIRALLNRSPGAPLRTR